MGKVVGRVVAIAGNVRDKDSSNLSKSVDVRKRQSIKVVEKNYF